MEISPRGFSQRSLTNANVARRAYTTAAFHRVPYRSMKREAASSQPSTADLVHETVQSAERPLTFEEIFARVSTCRPLTTRNHRVVEGEAGSCEAWFESRGQRNAQAVAVRNRELADAAEKVLGGSRSTDVHISDVVVALLGRVCTARTPRPTRLRTYSGRTRVSWLPGSMRGCWRLT